jgi:hypothetical protein
MHGSHLVQRFQAFLDTVDKSEQLFLIHFFFSNLIFLQNLSQRSRHVLVEQSDPNIVGRRQHFETMETHLLIE